jgi:hydroxypyruvate isomerase
MASSKKPLSARQTMCWWCFAQTMKPEEIVKEAKSLGIAGFEIVPPEHWQLVKDNGMQVVGIGGHGTFGDGLNRKENHARIEHELLENIEKASKNGIRNLICFSGNRAGLDDKKGIENTAEGLLRVTKAAEKAKVTLVIELLNSKVDHPDYMGDHTSWGVEVCKKVKSPSVKLLYDVYHMQIMEGDVIRTIRDNIDYIGHFHIAGNPGRSNIDDTQELNYKGILKAIADTNYTGFVGHEYVPTGDAVKVLKQTVALFK